MEQPETQPAKTAEHVVVIRVQITIPPCTKEEAWKVGEEIKWGLREQSYMMGRRKDFMSTARMTATVVSVEEAT